MYAPVLPATPPDGWTLENLPPDLPKHTELIRGALIMSPQKSWHAWVIVKLFNALDAAAPEEYLVEHEMAVRKSKRSAPQPDLSIVRAAAYDAKKSIYLPEDVLLAVEVVSPESEERDWEEKPAMYAMMGISSFWLVEHGQDDSGVVHEHRLCEGEYRLVRVHTGRLVTDVPFPIDTSLNFRRR